MCEFKLLVLGAKETTPALKKKTEVMPRQSSFDVKGNAIAGSRMYMHSSAKKGPLGRHTRSTLASEIKVNKMKIKLTVETFFFCLEYTNRQPLNKMVATMLLIGKHEQSEATPV